MTTLEEAIFKQTLTEDEKNHIEKTIKPLIPQLEVLQAQIDHLKNNFLKVVKKDQFDIIDDIVSYNDPLFKKNQLELHQVIQKDSEIINSIQKEKMNKEQTTTIKKESNYEKLTHKIGENLFSR